MADERKILVSTKPIVQNLMIENREKIKITGVLDVDSFNDLEIVAQTELGKLIIKGKGLKISKLNLENSELCIEGSVYLCEYEDKGKGGGGFFSKMLK